MILRRAAGPFDSRQVAADNPQMLELCDVSKRFGAAVALHRIQLTFPAGKTTALIGPSGCGKSTLLRMIVGLVVPDAGQVRLEGAPIGTGQWRAVRRRMGYVIQEGGLFPHLTIAHNVTLVARTMRMARPAMAQRLDQLAQLVHLPGALLARYPHQLSGGERQRASLMRALFLDPDVLLLDEPLGALDPLIRSDLQAELRDIFRTLQKTVVLVTHDLPEARFLGDVIVLMQQGRIVQRGSFEDLVERPADPFVQRFLRAQNLGPVAI